jgi:hyperosmotically inducible periplasmic protein
MRSFTFAVLTAVTFVGCTEDTRSTGTAAKSQNDQNQSRTVTAAKPVADGAAVDRDNTAVNARDRNATAKTPMDQNENKKDIDITANIRKRVVDTKMSLNAKNAKIITQDGKVTLRGPVKSAEEKTQIEEIARDVAGKDNVDSQLEVQTKQ